MRPVRRNLKLVISFYKPQCSCCLSLVHHVWVVMYATGCLAAACLGPRLCVHALVWRPAWAAGGVS